MGQRIVIISLFLLLGFSDCLCQEKGQSIWVLYDNADSLCYKVGIKEWYFFRSSLDDEPLRFVKQCSHALPDTLYNISPAINLVKREDLALIQINEKDKMVYTHKKKKMVTINNNWFNEIYESIYVVEPKGELYFVFRVNYNYCHVDYNNLRF